MTNEEAVKILRRIQEPEAWEPQINGAAFEALDMAIEALGRQQAAGSKDLISRSSLLAKYDEQHEGPPGRARKLIEDEPPVLGTNLAEVGTDCISRQAAIDTLENTKTAISENGERYIAKQNAIMRIDALPSAQPKLLQPWEVLVAQAVLSQPKMGKWERHYSRPNVYADLFWHCSECGYRSSDNWADKFNFCPHCGAMMEK